jgi:hypothetical protein
MSMAVDFHNLIFAIALIYSGLSVNTVQLSKFFLLFLLSVSSASGAVRSKK